MVPPKEMLPVVIKPHSAAVGGYIRSMESEVSRMGRVSDLVIDNAASRPEGSAVVVGETADCFVVIGAERIAAEIQRLKKELSKTAAELQKFEAKLNNAAFVANASPEVVDEVREKAETARGAAARMTEALETLEH